MTQHNITDIGVTKQTKCHFIRNPGTQVNCATASLVRQVPNSFLLDSLVTPPHCPVLIVIIIAITITRPVVTLTS